MCWFLQFSEKRWCGGKEQFVAQVLHVKCDEVPLTPKVSPKLRLVCQIYWWNELLWLTTFCFHFWFKSNVTRSHSVIGILNSSRNTVTSSETAVMICFLCIKSEQLFKEREGRSRKPINLNKNLSTQWSGHTVYINMGSLRSEVVRR